MAGKKQDNVVLSQLTDFATVKFESNFLSIPFPTNGLRGIALHVSPNGCNTAYILFAIHHPAHSGKLHDSTGNLIRVDNIVVGDWMVAPVDVWALGAATLMQLVSVAAGSSTPVNQTNEVIILRLR